LVTILDSLIGPYRQLIAKFAQEQRIPSILSLRDYAEFGGLMSYGPSLPEIYRRAATYVDKLLKGARPGDLPIEQPTKFELVINLKAARALNLAIPRTLLLRADQVISRTEKGRQRRPVSRVLFPERLPVRGDDHFSTTPVTRRLQRPNPGAARATP
jgi:ABC transporter substrate binding protein